MLQFPPFARGNHGPARHQRRITGPRPAHPAANAGPHPATTRPNQPQPRPPGHTRSSARPATAHRPTQRGVCTIKRTATACRRRVAPLMLQFPPIRPQQPRPRPPPATDHRAAPGPRGRQRRTAPVHNAPQPTATSPARPRPVVCPPNHRSPAHSTGGFCTIRRTATACRRRVAPLMLQFPHSPGQERLPHRRQPRRRPWQAHPTPHRAQPPPHPRSGSTPRPQPRASQPPATNGATFGQHPLFSQNEIRSTQFAYTVTNRSSTH